MATLPNLSSSGSVSHPTRASPGNPLIHWWLELLQERTDCWPPPPNIISIKNPSYNVDPKTRKNTGYTMVDSPTNKAPQEPVIYVWPLTQHEHLLRFQGIAIHWWSFPPVKYCPPIHHCLPHPTWAPSRILVIQRYHPAPTNLSLRRRHILATTSPFMSTPPPNTSSHKNPISVHYAQVNY